MRSWTCKRRGILPVLLGALLCSLAPGPMTCAGAVPPVEIAPAKSCPVIGCPAPGGEILLAELEEDEDRIIHQTVPYDETEDLWEQEKYKQERAWDMLTNPFLFPPSGRPGIRPPNPPIDRNRE